MKVPYVDIANQFFDIEQEVMSAVHQVLSSGKYILGEQVAKFEQQFAEFCDVEFAFGVANGTDALVLAMKALDIGQGDEVITPANSWISSTSAIALCGATPVFADIKPDQLIDPLEVEKKITARTKAIMPVHLMGKMVDMKAICAIAEKHHLKVIEDAAQAVGSAYGQQKAGAIGDIGCFSLHPLKNLNAAGDAGVVTTNSPELAEKISLLRQHGLESRNEVKHWGYNSRLDELQAAILNCKFPGLPQIIERRRHNAKLYRELLSGLSNVVELISLTPDTTDSNHLFVIQCERRDALKDYLKTHQISTAIHYPTPIHLQPAANYLGYKVGDLPVTESCAKRILSLPIHQHLSEQQIRFVAEKIIAFYQS